MKKTIRKLASLMLALIMVIGVLANPAFAAEKTFDDVAEGEWYYGYIMMLANDENEIVGGYKGTDLFKPDEKLSRREAAKMIALAAKFEHEGKKADFEDVLEGDWATGYIAALADAKVVQGFGTTGEFRPGLNIKRGHAAKMVSLAFGLEKSSLSRELEGLPKNDPVVKEAIDVLASNGIVKGYKGTQDFKWDQDISRAEFSKIVCIGMVASALQKAEAEGATPGQIAEAQELLERLTVAAAEDEDQEGLEHLQERADELELRVVEVKAITETIDTKAGQQLEFAVNGETVAAKLADLTEAGYTVTYEATVAVSPAGVVDGATVGVTSFEYRVVISHDDLEEDIVSELQEVEVLNYEEFATEITEVKLSANDVVITSGKIALADEDVKFTSVLGTNKAGDEDEKLMSLPYTIKFTSSKPAVAVIDAAGEITPLSVGKT